MSLIIMIFRSDQFERKLGGGYDADEFEEHPERYISTFAHKYAPYASVIVNGIYWSPAVSISINLFLFQILQKCKFSI